MSCYACSKQYGFWTKEVGCPNCGFSFCTKCLKKEIEVPRCGNAVKKVCLSCHEKLSKARKENEIKKETSKTSSAATSSTLPNIVIPKGVSVLDAAFPEADQLPDVDEALKKRLQSLQEPEAEVNLNTLPSDADLKERLANLQGVPNKEYNNFDIINKVDKRSEEEQTRDLIKQFLEENNIDEAANPADAGENYVDPIEDIERRLAALKGSPVAGDNKNEFKRTDEDVEGIVDKYMEEAKLPDFDLTPEEKEFVNNAKPTSADQEELPWCTICNEDAVIRCVGCDGDLFCRSCFKEIHANDEEYREHPTKIYTKPANCPHDNI